MGANIRHRTAKAGGYKGAKSAFADFPNPFIHACDGPVPVREDSLMDVKGFKPLGALFFRPGS